MNLNSDDLNSASTSEMHLQMYIYMPSVGSCDNGVNGVSFALSVRLSCSALSDG